jgi:hypothetical protein
MARDVGENCRPPSFKPPAMLSDPAREFLGRPEIDAHLQH